MKICIIGAVAAGTSVAAKARRNNEDAEIKIYDMDSDISYSGCGLPYYIGTEVKTREELVPRDAAFFKTKYNVDIFTKHRVLEINVKSKVLKVENIINGTIFNESYDTLVIATGATSFVPQIEGIEKENVFTLRNVQSADRIRNYIIQKNPQSAIIVGSGFIGLELAENLKERGLDVTIVEMADHAMPALDKDVSLYLEKHLTDKGITLILKDSVVTCEGNARVTCAKLVSGRTIDTDMVIIATGIKPNVSLAEKAGVKIGQTGAIHVNSRMQTNIKNIYACGDCAESFSLITRKPIYRPLGSTANKMGRIAGDQITGGTLEFRGILGTGIFKVFDMTVAQTGLTEKEALKSGYSVAVCHNIKPDKPEYFHGSEMVIKAIADKETGRILGVQIIGKSGVDKRIDVLVTAITFGAKAEDLFHLDLAYAPPFATTKDPTMYTGMILDNAIHRGRPLITPFELKEKLKKGERLRIIDVRSSSQYLTAHIDEAINLPQEKIRTNIDAIDKTETIVTYCNKGVTGNAAQNILINKGFKKVYNLSGGFKNYKIINRK
jgi:NADPH-dependent 2,4-dienoyl-CoA reductase/sulfur reductase-like enzyme/rhodanese-related sulfurtransferase